jgi:hypothetical protein
MELFLKGNSGGKYVFRNSVNKTIYIKDIKTENLTILEGCLKYIENTLNYSFLSFTIDGRKGVIQLLERLYPNIPIQLCQFHQIKTILTYTTRNPKTECAKDLKELILLLTKSDKEIFLNNFNNLSDKYKDFLKEKSETDLIDRITGEILIENSGYKHPRLRSAFRSIKTNMKYLFTYKNEKYLNLKIPNTTNCCDGKFGAIKGKIKIHRGLKVERKSKMFNKLIWD